MLSFHKITIISCLFQQGKERVEETSMIEHIHQAVEPKSEANTIPRRLTLSP